MVERNKKFIWNKTPTAFFELHPLSIPRYSEEVLADLRDSPKVGSAKGQMMHHKRFQFQISLIYRKKRDILKDNGKKCVARNEHSLTRHKWTGVTFEGIIKNNKKMNN